MTDTLSKQTSKKLSIQRKQGQEWGVRRKGNELVPYLVKLENPFVQHNGISLAVSAYGFFFRRFSKINWSRRASRSFS